LRLYVATLLSLAESDIMEYEDRAVAESSRRNIHRAILACGDSTWVVREYRVARLPLRKLAPALYNRAFWAAEGKPGPVHEDPLEAQRG
jgi:hypothetical protein